ncbi:MarR family winged helix-turn-helix transcriptional regulator [Heyndrickxia oleronia]|jgi:DNA-binding MarR family transcriptional regulator|uniref:MarR family winged helix-turn-helix transcriptional regulator n=1 Tax=Heyndrickxia oleronia TaxID=38875 RepID=UPI002432E2B0|nr:MarR family transcriptional regulator [Heyndrickxia oleronia]MCI1590214.1 MarR family transcriptional regulator [Heyndrickxia oleronia]MCI1613996.1 MarR family transcriptional regulator [Heyndrickxia oleronia]MCI1744353.1 MarR family transcriptional regulator [Heyndrickxia oleronia]MCI1761857.1 MarR family transcriptional regulator [Heyndrickxia oleronia]
MSREIFPTNFPEIPMIQKALLHELRQNSARAVMLHQLISEKMGLNATDHKCLDYLNRTGPVTAGQLADITGLTTGAVTNIIDRLEKAGYVIRDKDPNDRRRVVVKPIPEGSAQLSPMFHSIMQSTLNIISRYNEQEILLILDFIRQCNEMTLVEMNKMKTESDL